MDRPTGEYEWQSVSGRNNNNNNNNNIYPRNVIYELCSPASRVSTDC